MNGKGMQFFKKLGGQKGSSLFGGMKVKGPSKVAQSQSNLSVDSDKIKREKEMEEKRKISEEAKEKQQSQNYNQNNAKNSQVENAISDEEDQGTFQLPGISKAKLQQKPTPIKHQNPARKPDPVPVSVSKKPSSQNQQHQIKPYQVDSYQSIDDIDEMSVKSTENSLRKDSDRKQSASESNYVFDKKKRKQSNPFLNQIKKATVSLNKDQQQQKQKQDMKPAKKSDKQLLLSQITQVHIKSIQFFMQQKQLKQQIIQIATNISQNKQQLAQSIQKQCVCIQKQEYEQADSFQNKIENLQSKIIEQQIELQRKQEQFYKNQYDQLKIQRNQNHESKALVRKIKLVQIQLVQESSNIKRKSAEHEENENIKIENENKKIVRLENDIKFQSEQIIDFQQKYQQDLQSRKNPLDQELNQNNQLKLSLEQEIRELQAKLKTKKQNLKEVISKISFVKKQIQQVTDTFREQGLKLQQRKRKLQNLSDEKNNLIKGVKVLEKKKTQDANDLNKKCQVLQKQAAIIAQIAIQIEQNSFNFEDKLEDKKVKVDNFIHNTKQLKTFQANHKQKKQKIKELEFQKSNIVGETNSLEQKKTQAKSKIPKLQQEQKQLAQAKNFKGAGMKKTEIKQAQESIETFTKKISECYAKEKQIQEEINKRNEEQNQFINEENEIRKNLAISQFRFDKIKWQQLIEEKQWVEKIGKDSQIGKKYYHILIEDMEGLVEEIKYIGEEYGIDISFLQNREFQKAEKIRKFSEKKNGQKIEEVKQVVTKPQQEVPQQTQNKQELEPQTQISQQQPVKDEPIQIHQQPQNSQNQIQVPEQTEEAQSQSGPIPTIQQNGSDDLANQNQSGHEQEQQQLSSTHQQLSQNQHEDDEQDNEGYVPLQLD